MEFLANVVTADILFEQLNSCLNVVSTGCSNLDDILGGGLYSGELTEIFGLPSVGKTQACLGIACHVAGSLCKNVFYIDSTGGFSGQRIHEILMARHDENAMHSINPMARIQCIKTFEIFHALFVLDELKKCLSFEEDAFYQDVVLVIVDSVASLISPILGGHGHGMMVRFSRALKSLANDYNVAVLLTNNVVSDMNSSCTKPALGITWARMPNTRILFYDEIKESPSQKLVKVTDTKSVKKPLRDAATISISESGLH